MHGVEEDLRSSPGRTWENLVDQVEYSRMRQITIRLLFRG